MKNFFQLSFFTILGFLMIVNSALAYQISASTDKMVYVVNENMTISGKISNQSQINLNATMYDSTLQTITNLNTNSSNGEFTFSGYLLNETTSPAGSYSVVVTDGSDSVTLYFTIISELIFMEAHLLGSSDVKNADTSTLITSGGDLGGNFSELLDLSISGTLHYGNITNMTGDSKDYHFVLVDQNYNESYDTLYVDDDKMFLMYNDTEDSGSSSDLEYQSLREGDKLLGMLIGEVEDTGNKIILATPAEDPVYDFSETVNFIVLVKNASKNLMASRTVGIRLMSSVGSVLDTSSGNTNTFGYFVDSFTAPSTAGIYTISLNDSIGVEVFAVESFELLGKVTNLDGEPTYSFASNPNVRINLISKNPSGDPFDLDSASFVLSYPNGSISNFNLVKKSTGVYSYDIDLDGAPMGDYGVRIIGVDGSAQQEFYTGFAIEAVRFEAMAMNHDFMGQIEGPGGEVSAFAPRKNITLLAMLLNISAGGMFSMEGPEGAIDIDNESTAIDECGTLVEILDLRDERDVSHINEISYSVKNLTDAMLYFGADPYDPEEAPPPQLVRQCMIIIDGLNKTGIYNAKMKVSHPLGEKITGVNFEIQKLLARGSTVDFKGEEFSFFAPGNVVRIKLKVMDLTTREELNATSILGAKIINMRREFPGFKEIDIKTNISNESVVNGTIEFVAPEEEGFYSMKFRFKANVSGQIEEGIGTG
jgi:hypothetical protein